MYETGNKMRNLKSMSAAMFFIGASSVAAETATGQYATYAVGAQSCATVLEAYQSSNQANVLLEVSSWLSGYISGVNRLTDETYDITPVMNHASLTVLTLRLCENNRDQLYESVVNALLGVFEPLRVTQESQGIQVGRDGQVVMLRQSSIRLLQEELVSSGFLDAQSVDGVVGPKTLNAVREWQKANNQAETGTFDPFTILGLLQDEQ
jgi:hypothetical protein